MDLTGWCEKSSTTAKWKECYWFLVWFLYFVLFGVFVFGFIIIICFYCQEVLVLKVVFNKMKILS